MDKLGQITIDNTLNVIVSCQVDQHLLAKNFTTIINALKELQQGQLKNESQIKDLSSLNSLKDKFNSLTEKIEKIQKDHALAVKESAVKQSKPIVPEANQSKEVNNLGDFGQIIKRLDKNEANILDNIKDINLINKEIVEVRKDINDLKNKNITQNKNSKVETKQDNLDKKGKSDSSSNNNLQTNDKFGYGINQIVGNLSKQLSMNLEKMKDLQSRLGNAEDHIKKLQQELKNFIRGTQNNNNVSTKQSSEKDNKDIGDLTKDMKDKLDVINQKLKNLQSETDHHDQQISYIKDILSQTDRNNEQIPVEALVNGVDETASITASNTAIKIQLTQLRKKIEQVNQREKKDVKKLIEEISSLKLFLTGLKSQKGQKNQKSQKNQKNLNAERGEGIQSKTSLQDEGQNSNNKRIPRKSITQKNGFAQKLNDLVIKVNYLQKMISGSKHSIGGSDEKTGGLPTISRPTKKNLNLTGFPDKDKSGIGRKDLSDLKSELQAWITSLLDQGRERENSQDLYLKIQEIKHAVQKKADADGTKKGLKFLQSKITQLYLFLTEPETEDAMIVRKGFNCLSCSKNVEKLRGRLGPRTNWNNMTSTNYSPPRVGYSRPLGQQSALQKQDDL